MKKKQKKTVSIILPTFNESKNIIQLIQLIIENVPNNFEYKIIIVDDNSPDKTFNLVKIFFKDNNNIIPILRIQDKGFAKSIKRGIDESESDFIIVLDSDFTHNPSEIAKLLYVAEKFDFVSASRFCAGGRMVDKTHYLCSLIFNWFLRILIRTQVQDNLGGFFATQKKIIDKLPYEKIFFGYGDYYFRLLHYIQENKFSVVEIPSIYLHRKNGSSKSNWVCMIFTYFIAAIRLKWEIRNYIVNE